MWRLFPLILAAAPLAWTQSGSDGIEMGKELTIEVDSSQTKNRDKSLGLALLGSALLPGTGEVYLGESGAARNFLMVEAGFWAGIFIAWQMQQSYLQSGRNYASEFAGAGASNMSASYLETLASYRSYAEAEHRQDSYELNQVLSGNRDGNYSLPAQGNTWDFGSSNTPENTSHWHEFQSVMRYYRGANVAISFAVGALALNRVVALAHTLRVYRRTSGKGLGLHFDPLIGPDFSGMRVALKF
jgi:hypothetical protein